MNGRQVATFVLVDSDDISGSIGKPDFLPNHLHPTGESNVRVEVTAIPAARCDIIARRIDGGQEKRTAVPPTIEAWYGDMTDPVEIADTTSLFAVSLADTVRAEVFRDAETGVLVQPPIGYREMWTSDATAWLHENFESDPPTIESITQALCSIADGLGSSGADLVVFNTSTFVPDEKVYWFRRGEPDTISVRASRMNLVVDTLVKELDITLVDVDRVAAEIGAEQAVIGPATYTQETLETLSQEAIAMILDLEGISQMFGSDVMQLNMPRYDRRTATATLTRWHVEAETAIDKGDALFDLRFGNVSAKLDDHGRETDRAIDMSVVAGRGGFVESISVSPGTELDVGARVGVVTARRGAVGHDIDNAARFPVGVRVVGRDDR